MTVYRVINTAARQAKEVRESLINVWQGLWRVRTVQISGRRAPVGRGLDLPGELILGEEQVTVVEAHPGGSAAE